MEKNNRTDRRSRGLTNFSSLARADKSLANSTHRFQESSILNSNISGLEDPRNSTSRYSRSCDGFSALVSSVTRTRCGDASSNVLNVRRVQHNRRSISAGNVKDNNPLAMKKLAPYLDRFIPCRSAMDIDRCDFLMNNKENSVGSPSENGVLDEQTLARRKLLRLNDNVLKFRRPPTQPLIDDMVRRWTEWSGCVEDAKLLQRAKGKLYRNVKMIPERILDAPDIRDDFYTQLLDWSFCDVVGIALDNRIYAWNAKTQESCCLSSHEETISYYSALAFHPRDHTIASVLSNGTLELMDYDTCSIMRKISVNHERVAAIDWHSTIIACGSREGTINLHDTKCPRSLIESIPGAHWEEICGLRWSPCKRYIASGGNDNRVHIWDSRYVKGRRTNKSVVSLPHSAHKAAVKALAWCPWHGALLATGGGASCRSIRLTNVHKNQTICHVKDTGSQVTGLLWSETHHELLSSHGPDKFQLTLWRSFPSRLVRLSLFRRSRIYIEFCTEARDEIEDRARNPITQHLLHKPLCELVDHSGRVVGIAQSPNEQTVVSACSDERLRFWDCFAADENSAQDKEESEWTDFDQLYRPADGCHRNQSLFPNIR